MSELWGPARPNGKKTALRTLRGADAGDSVAATPPPIGNRPPANATRPTAWEARGRRDPAPEGAAAVGEYGRVLTLIDGLRLRRECLTHLLKAGLPDFDVVAVDDIQPVDAWRVARPEVVLFAAPATGRRPIDEIAEAVAAADDVPVLLLSDAGEALDADAAAKVGVAGLFPSTCGISLLIAAIQLVLAGGRFHIPASQPGASPRPFGGGAPR